MLRPWFGPTQAGMNRMNSRDLVKRFLRRQPAERAPFLPVAFYQASRIDGAPAAELIGEPQRLARAAIELSGLIGADTVSVRLEAPLCAACGLDLAWPADDDAPLIEGTPTSPPDAAGVLSAAGPILEAVAAIKGVLRGQKPVLAVLPGPLAFAGRWDDEAGRAGAGAALRGLADALCKAGAEIVVLEETDAVDEMQLKRLAGPVVNTIRYYSASTILAVPAPLTARIADALLLPGGAPLPPPGTLLGLAATRTEMTDATARDLLGATIAGRPGEVFLSLDDSAMAGIEMPDIAGAVAGLTGDG
jgi:hypothetical protein